MRLRARAGVATNVKGPFSNGPYTTPDCATCHREHQGRVQLAATADKFCVDCHSDLTPGKMPTPPGGATSAVVRSVGAFPEDHAEFAVLRTGSKDPGTLRFNHEVHNSPTLRGPSGPEKLECTTCHKPEISRVSSQKRTSTGLMASINYEQQCARCHTLFFDERLDLQVPHEHFRVGHGPSSGRPCLTTFVTTRGRSRNRTFQAAAFL